MSSDPHVLYGDYTATGPRDHRKGKGAIRAFGEHKGSGLALMCELLGGSLTGMSATGEDQRFGNGMLSFYIDPKIVDPEAMFSRRRGALHRLLQERQADRRRAARC